MVPDLLANHLRWGTSLGDVTNLLGWPETQVTNGRVLRLRGEFLAQTVYVYRPGMHNGWSLEGNESLILYFGRDGEQGTFVRDWTPLYAVVGPVSAVESEATKSTLTEGGLHIGNLRFASSRGQFGHLLGPPDEERTECHLTYCLGKLTFCMGRGIPRVHFNKDKQLTRIQCTEH